MESTKPIARMRCWGLAALLAVPMLAMAAADPQITSFTDNPDPVPSGGLLVYGIGVDNNDADPATNVVVTMPVPAGAQFVSASAPCALVGPNVVCNLGTVGGNGTDPRQLSVTVRATVAGGAGAFIDATATLTAASDVNAGNNTASARTTVDNGANLSLTKAGNPNPAVGGSNVTYTLSASNAGPNDSGNVVITDNLSPSSTFVSASGSGWTCSHSAGVVTCTRPGPQPVGALPAVTIVAKVTTAGGTITNSASIAPASIGGIADPDLANNTATVDTVVTPGADVSIAQKSVISATPIVAGSTVSFLIQPRNAGPAVATTVTLTDPLPAGWTFVTANGNNWSCGAVAQLVTCTRASMPVGSADNITVVAIAPNNAALGGISAAYTNTASITSAVTDPNGGNNSGSVNMTVFADGADLSLTKSKSPNPVALGSQMTSVLRVTNGGPRTATGTLRVVDVLNANERFDGYSGSGWVCTATGQTVVCDNVNVGGLAVGSSLPDLLITTTAMAAGNLVNNACTGSSLPGGQAAGTVALPPAQGDLNAGNDCASAGATSTTLTPDLTITKATSTPVGGDKVVTTSEGSVTYTLRVNNLTPGNNASGIVITDTVPAYIGGRTTISPVTASVSAGTATFNCAIAGATVTCTQTGGQLAVGQTVTVPITVNRPMLDGNFTNTATVGNTAEGDPARGNNSASDTVQIDPIADVELTGKSVTPSPVIAGTPATYVISYRNNGPSTAQGVVVNDVFAIPGGDTGATVVSIASSKGTCTGISAGMVITGAAPFSCNIGALANNESQSITLVVRPNFMTGNPARSWNNTASITTTTVENPAGGENGNNSRTATLPISPADVDLLINKIDFVDPVPFDGNAFMDYRLRVTSRGPSFATNVQVTENMTPPAGKRVRFVCDTTGQQSAVCNTPSLCSAVNLTSAAGTAIPAFTCTLPVGNSTTGPARGDLAANQSKDVFLRFEAIDAPPSTGDVYTNQATVAANEPDAIVGNNTATEQTTVRQRIDLSVTKAVSASLVTVKQPFTWTITVINKGPGTSLQTDLTDTLPIGVVVTGPMTWTKTSPAATGTCTALGNLVSCALGALDNQGVVTISIPARYDAVPAGGTVTNTATVDTTPSKIGGIDPVPGNNAASVPVTVTASSLAGTVFQDRDRSGANGGIPQAAGTEPRISGVTLTLTGTDAYGNVVNLTTTTDASGNYRFDYLAPSNAAGYTITETQPAGFNNSPSPTPASGALAPSAGGTYNAGGTAGNSSHSGIVLGGASAGVNYNFPELRRPSLSGFVYLDINQDGVRGGAGDLPVNGATVRLLNATTGAVVSTTTTDANGAYGFTNLDPSVLYTLEEPLPSAPANLSNGATNPGLIGGSACATGCTAQSDFSAGPTDRIASIDLSTGVDGTNFNFGELVPAVISGTVYADRNRNGTMDPAGTDGRLAGVTLTLYNGTTCSGAPVATRVTDATGQYAFANLGALLPYSVCETQPAGYADSATNPGTDAASNLSNRISINSLAMTGSPNNNFGEQVATLSGYVYIDGNNDGSRLNEIGLSGVSVTLSGSDAGGNPITRTVLTDGTGGYRFDDLPGADAAGYTVTEQRAQPQYGNLPTANGITTAGSLGGTATGVSTLPSAITNIHLPAGGNSAENNFGELLLSQLSGTVYLDRNVNNVYDPAAGDSGLAGVRVELHAGGSCAGPLVDYRITDVDGRYSFTSLQTGSAYALCEMQPAAYRNGATNPGQGATTPAANVIVVPSLPSGGTVNNNFGEVPGSLSGKVFLDQDNDGAPANEPGLPGVTMTLTGTDVDGNAISRTVQTDPSGNWTYANLPASGAGGYTVTEQAAQPVYQGTTTTNGITTAGSAGGSATAVTVKPSAVSGIVLPAGTNGTDYNFGEVLGANLSGTVYIDRNNNGTMDGSPTDGRLGGVTLTLHEGGSCSGALLGSTLTDAQGRYNFGPLASGGTYTVCEEQPAGYAQGTDNPGTNGSTGAVNAITVTRLPVTGSANNNFGEIPPEVFNLGPDLVVSKAANEATFTTGQPASYALRVRNIGVAPTTGSYTVSDHLPAGLTLAATPIGNGWVCGGNAGASNFSCSSSNVLAIGAEAPVITATVNVAAEAATSGSTVNVALVEGGGEPDSKKPTPAERDAFDKHPGNLPLCTTPPSQNACRTDTPVKLGTPDVVVSKTTAATSFTPGRNYSYTLSVRNVGGAATSGSYSLSDRLPAGMTLAAAPIGTGWVCTGAAGASSFGCSSSTVLPAGGNAGDITVQVTLATTLANGASLTNAALAEGGGEPDSSKPTQAERDAFNGNPDALPLCAKPAAQNACRVVTPVAITPTGVVYDSLSRDPIAGATVTLTPVGSCPGWSPGQQVLGAGNGSYTVNGKGISMVTGLDGVYTFVLLPNAPALCHFAITVTPPYDHQFVSKDIPPSDATLHPSGGPGSIFPVQPQPTAPTADVGPGTTYHLDIDMGSSTADVANNHIPLDLDPNFDPTFVTQLHLRKTGDRQQVEIGGTVRYAITISMAAGALPSQVTVLDRLPAGFTYVAGTAMAGDRPIADPAGGRGPTLAFDLGAMPATGTVTLYYRARADVGSLQGDGINRATGFACKLTSSCVNPGSFTPKGSSLASNEAQYQVKVTAGVFTTDACVMGKVFVDCNGNHVQDAEELGIPGVRLVMQDGTTLVSDSEGKYSVCGLAPKSAVLRIDPLTLPRGSRLTTSSNRNLGDAGSLWLDLKNGELHRADFIEGSCSNTVLEQVKARRAQGEVRAPETEQPGQPALRFDSKAHGLNTLTSPQQGTDGANQWAPKARPDSTVNSPATAPSAPVQDEQNRPTPSLPMNQPPPTGRSPGDAPGAPATAAKEAGHGTR